MNDESWVAIKDNVIPDGIFHVVFFFYQAWWIPKWQLCWYRNESIWPRHNHHSSHHSKRCKPLFFFKAYPQSLIKLKLLNSFYTALVNCFFLWFALVGWFHHWPWRKPDKSNKVVERIFSYTVHVNDKKQYNFVWLHSST